MICPILVIISEKMLPRETCWLLCMLYLTTTYLSQTGGQDCRYIYNSSVTPTVNHGIFHTPNYPRKYPVSTRCLYIFIGKGEQRVEMEFKTFNLQGVAPLCQFDYLDIYTQVTDVARPHIDTPLLGRFCGDGIDRLPKLIISSANIIILDFYSDFIKADTGFEGRYSFVNDSVYRFGNRKPGLCDYTINSVDQVSGYIISPTYPGMYPDNLHCTYRLVGKLGQRIKITFIDFSLFHGGDYCPVDFVSIHDGANSLSDEIGRFCGNYKNVVMYSSYENLYILFKTQSGRIDTLNAGNLEGDADFLYNRRGFNITYEFSDNFVKPMFSSDDRMTHIIGTACDVQISSKRRSSGAIRSPGYPNKLPVGVTCNYYLDGMSNKETLEKVQISFQDFEIPGQMPYCNSGFLVVNLKGSEGLAGVDERFCGSLLPPNLTSQDARMVMTFDTHGGHSSSRGFSATYQFVTDFGIRSGFTPEVGKCIFLYESQRLKESKDGTFNSPYYPDPYPANTKCEYIFRPAANERLLISFYAFALGPNNLCFDSLTIDQQDYRGNYTRIKSYCGSVFPGPILGGIGKEIRIVFLSRERSRNPGFNAKFEFLNGRLQSKCGANITSFGEGGLIKSPDYPEKYKSYTFCQWMIKASNRMNKILIDLDFFHLEGKEKDVKEDEKGGDASRVVGCKDAVFRLSYDLTQPARELCGQQKGQVFLSLEDYFMLEFVTSDRALGAKGFKITWTEVHDTGPCRGFKCAITQYCIHESLKCNGQPNCGNLDSSDETMGCPQPGKFEVIHIAVGASISSFFCIILVVCGFYHRKKFRHNPKPPDNDQVEVRYVAASSSNNTADRLLAIDHHDENGSHKSAHVSVQSTTPKLPNRTPNQVPKQIHNPSVEKISQCSSHSSFSPSVTSNQSPKIASIPRTSSRTPRIQKVSIV